ncbi:hypothetical protein LF1_33820 [Rubripirellula obstinata]|uniref:GxxExxY protein n=1 Tax=Rubripirellula obstinata TaxID=406547 RepID=A0A5B1CMP9_9BACT|nr:GxxExxY protein [Rubripirellula obstinata]KAA1260840.1 hypothetical protein LF1_33820 [Rubripirellula obstinata]
MPIETSSPVKRFSQDEFGAVAYEVVGHAFSLHQELGRVFDESPIRSTLSHIIGQRAKEEVCVRLMHRNFEKRYYIDLLVDSGCPFELKTVSELVERHRLQLIQYLMLTDLRHGKLINFGSESLQHEFVNCHESTEHRRRFRLDSKRWTTNNPVADRFQETIVELLRDWGTGLDHGLYTEAVTHFLGGPDVVRQTVETLWDDKRVGKQVCSLLAPNEAFKITALRRNIPAYELHLRQFLKNTSLNKIYWVNVVSGEVQFVVIE